MKAGVKTAVSLVVVAALVGGAYWLGSSRGNREAATTEAPQAAAPAARPLGPGAGPIPEGRVAPPNHQQFLADPAQTPQASGRNLDFTHFRVGNRNVKDIFADGDLVWVGTSGGVVRYNTVTDDYRLYDVRTGLLSNGVFHVSRLGDKLVVGTYGGGLSLLDLKTDTWDNYNIQHGLGDAFVYDFVQAANGDLWIATWSGANRVRGGKLDDRSAWDTFTVANTAGGLPNDWVYGLMAGPDGSVWFATEGGIARFKDEQWQNWKHADGVGAPYAQVKDQIEFKRDPAKESSHHARQKIEQGLGEVDIAYNPNYIVSLWVDDDGTVWAGTWGGGLVRFRDGRFTNFTVDDGLPANHVFMLRRDRLGKLWVGTSKGLARMESDEGKRYTVFTTADGLFADNIFSMDVTEKNSYWVGSFGGVARVEGLGTAE